MEYSERFLAIRRRLYLLYILNVADWICTVSLLSTGRFYEVNPLTRIFIYSIPLGLLIKCILPVGVIALILRLVNNLDIGGINIVSRFSTAVIIFYAVLCVNHIVNFISLFFD